MLCVLFNQAVTNSEEDALMKVDHIMLHYTKLCLVSNYYYSFFLKKREGLIFLFVFSLWCLMLF